MKSLKTVQTICKVFKVLSTIYFILAIVGAAGCVLGLAAYGAFGENVIRLGGVTVKSFIWKEANAPDAAVYLALATGAVICGAQIFLGYMAKRYFKHEVDAGTPFTSEGAKELRKLWILNMAVSLGAAVVCGIAVAIVQTVVPDVKDVNFTSFTTVGLGLVYLIVSFILEHGADLNRAGANAETRDE